jgi:predicted dehydrogenase
VNPLRAIVVGAGVMGRVWVRAVQESPDAVLAGVVDIDPQKAHASRIEDIAQEARPDFVINVSPPDAHYEVTMAAFRLGLSVLSEKPLAATMRQALGLVAASEVYGKVFAVSQSRRYEPGVASFREQIGHIGPVGILTGSLFRGPRFGGFRDQMAHPLLLDMAIHGFDLARYLLEARPVRVYCEEYNPSWSWYRGGAAATAIFEMAGGTRFVYTGSWCSDGHETPWNGQWRASGEHGTALWDGQDGPLDAAITASLRDFVTALRTGVTPMGECHDNIMSLAMVHAAIASAESGRPVAITDVIEHARYTGIPSYKLPT